MSRDDDPFDLNPRPKPPSADPTHEIGQMLDALSVHELTERIALLRTEIDRLEAARAAKSAASSAADAVFRRPA